MIYKVVILGSTGSIGSSSLKSIYKKKNYKIVLLTANKNINKLLKQCVIYNVKNAVIEDENKFKKFRPIFKKKKINLYLNLRKNINKILKYKVSYCINSISGIEGLEPTLKSIPLTRKILIANKESLICAWNIISKVLKKNKTQFIPIDSEHFSIWKLIKNEKLENLEKIYLTASGGPFLKKSFKQVVNIKPKVALNHPNWKMGKKISIDSSTMMNKIFEFIEAKKIFNLSKEKLSIIIQPSSFVHAIVFFKGRTIKFLAHDTDMTIPISNALEIIDSQKKKSFSRYIDKINSLEFQKPTIKQYPLLSLLDLIPENDSYFETILITINDYLVYKFLSNKISYISIHLNLLKLLKSPFLNKFYKLKPKNIYDIKRMIDVTKNHINNRITNYEKKI